MRVRRLWWLVVAVALIAIGAAVWWSRGDKVIRAPRISYARKLDVEAFTRQVAERLRRAKETAAAPKPAPAPPRHDKKWEVQGRGVMQNAGAELMKPCTIGPQELCDALGPLVAGCDGGDSQDCMAVGEYLVDNPPRATIAFVFFLQPARSVTPTAANARTTRNCRPINHARTIHGVAGTLRWRRRTKCASTRHAHWAWATRAR